MADGSHPGLQSENTCVSSVSLFDITLFLIRKRKLTVLCLLVFLVPGLVTPFLIPGECRSTTAILPLKVIDKFENLKVLTGLVGSQIQIESKPELCPVVLRSRLVTSAVPAEEYCLTGDREYCYRPPGNS